MQYERLAERARLPLERIPGQHMQTVADMDFLVTSVRRLLRTAQAARQIPSEHQPQLKLALKVFNSRWGNLTAVRDSLEHSDTAAEFPVPVVVIPTSGNGDGEFTFMWPGSNLNLGKLYEDARSIVRAIATVIEPAEGKDHDRQP